MRFLFETYKSRHNEGIAAHKEGDYPKARMHYIMAAKYLRVPSTISVKKSVSSVKSVAKFSSRLGVLVAKKINQNCWYPGTNPEIL
jgi:hypothetical protein